MNNSLDRIRVIKADTLDSEHYFQSLIEQACAEGLLGDDEIERLQCGCLSLLAHKSKQFSLGDSSIRVEKAQGIMMSNLFTIGLWLKTCVSPDDAIIALQNEPINEIYQKGCERIDTILASAKATHAKLMEQLVDTPNVFYRSTIDGGITGFFKLYYPDFAAHEIHITADYPAFNPIPKLAGIEFIQSYLDCLYYENLFCGYFAADDIHHLLCGYVEGYAEHVINIYEPVLLAVLGCTIAGTSARRLDISETESDYLHRLFTGMRRDKIAKTIHEAATELARLFACSHGLIQYIRNSLPMIISRIGTAVQGHTLDRVFIRPAFPENRPRITFSFGDKMENEEYRKVIEEVRQCRYTQDKIAMIKEHINSLADLEDTLLDAELNEEEIHGVLCMLSLPEIAALSKRHPLLSDVDMFELREREQTLRKFLHGYISGLPKKHQDMIAETRDVIQEE